jgi:hypothetical protein
VIKAHTADIGLRRDIQKQTADIRVLTHQFFGNAPFQRQINNRAADVLCAKLIQPRL